jgi:hypothetical protein
VDSFQTGFDPSIDGFAFANRFSWTQEEREAVRDLFAGSLDDRVDGAPEDGPGPLPDPVLAAGEEAPLPPVVFDSVLLEAAQDLADEFAGAVLRDGGGAYGLSGGMVVAALDYRAVNWVVPRGNGFDDQPTRDTPSGRQLRDYLWGRLVAAMDLNAPRLLEYLVVSRSGDRGATEWLRDRTREHWQHVTSALSATGDPVPVALVGTSTSPLQHQTVLAIGFDDPGDGTGRLYTYDPNLPDDVAVLDFDLRGPGVTTTRDDALVNMAQRGLLQGFFVEAYNSVRPPPTLAASLGVEPGCAAAGAPLHFSCDVVNRGYHRSPEFLVTILGDAGALELREPGFKTLDESIERTFATAGMFEDPGSHSAIATAVLINTSGTEVRRELAAMARDATPSVTVRSTPPVVIEPAHDCVSTAVAPGRRMVCIVSPGSLAWIPAGVEPSFEWQAAGQTGSGPEFAFTVPDTPGQPFEVRCTVAAAGCTSTGTEVFRPLPPEDAERMIAACAFLGELRVERLLPVLDPARAREPTADALLPLVDTMAAAAERFLGSLGLSRAAGPSPR